MPMLYDTHSLTHSVVLQVTVNWFQMQQAQAVSLPAHYQAMSESAKLYEPGECYAEFVRNLPKNLPKERVHSDSVSSDNTRYQSLWMHTEVLEMISMVRLKSPLLYWSHFIKVKLQLCARILSDYLMKAACYTPLLWFIIVKRRHHRAACGHDMRQSAKWA